MSRFAVWLREFVYLARTNGVRWAASYMRQAWREF